jgi:hypothetical protein
MSARSILLWIVVHTAGCHGYGGPSYPHLEGCFDELSSRYVVDALTDHPRTSTPRVQAASAMLPGLPPDGPVSPWWDYHLDDNTDPKEIHSSQQYSIDTAPPQRVATEAGRLQDTRVRNCYEHPLGFICPFVKLLRGADMVAALRTIGYYLDSDQAALLRRSDLVELRVEVAIILSQDRLPLMFDRGIRPISVVVGKRTWAFVEHHLEFTCPASMMPVGPMRFDGLFSCDPQVIRKDQLVQVLRETIVDTFSMPKLAARQVPHSSNAVLMRRADSPSLVLGRPYTELSTYRLSIIVEERGEYEPNDRAPGTGPPEAAPRGDDRLEQGRNRWSAEAEALRPFSAGLELDSVVLVRRNPNAATHYRGPSENEHSKYRTEMDAALMEVVRKACERIDGAISAGVCYAPPFWRSP